MDSTGPWTFYESIVGLDRSSLSGTEREIAAICDLRQEVNAGGFDAYFRYTGGDTASEALGALPAVLGQEWADLLTEAMSLFGQSYPPVAAGRAPALDGGTIDDELERLDGAFLQLEQASSADSRMAAYLVER